MKVLWITNIIFPDVCSELNMPTPIIGGWLYSSAKRLRLEEGVELAVASMYSGKNLKKLILNNVTYYLLPASSDEIKYHNSLEIYWEQVKKSFLPDIVHIHGTEYSSGLAYIKACGNDNVLISIQGLVSVIERYYFAGLETKHILYNLTFRDIVRNDNIFQQRNKFRERGKFEHKYLLSGSSIIGRTSWDRDHIWAVNPKAKYYYCNETLRDEFYDNEWAYDKCEKYSIFLSQASYPVKGLHQLLKAMPYILREFPETKIYIAGADPKNTSSFNLKLRLSGYGKYLKKLINKLNLADKITFSGFLTEQEIVLRYLKANVFVCPSSIENSPNSVGEAQLLGVPCVASYVGGIPDMIIHGETGLLYRFEEVEMLAYNICHIFKNKELANTLSNNAQNVARKRHSPEINSSQLLEIYSELLNDSKLR